MLVLVCVSHITPSPQSAHSNWQRPNQAPVGEKLPRGHESHLIRSCKTPSQLRWCTHLRRAPTHAWKQTHNGPPGWCRKPARTLKSAFTRTPLTLKPDDVPLTITNRNFLLARERCFRRLTKQGIVRGLARHISLHVGENMSFHSNWPLCDNI